MNAACRIFGHDPQFHAEGSTLHWDCRRGCTEGGGSKTYDGPDDATRYARAFNSRDSDNLGKRAPLLGLLPLRLWRLFSGRNK